MEDNTEKNGHSTSKPKVEDEASIKVVETDGSLKSHPREKKKLIDFRDKLYLAPPNNRGQSSLQKTLQSIGSRCDLW